MEASLTDHVWSLAELVGLLDRQSSGSRSVIFNSRFSWTHPYGWRTNLRILLPVPICAWIDKGEDCESQHRWYNHDNENSACYYCKIVRSGQLWEKH